MNVHPENGSENAVELEDVMTRLDRTVIPCLDNGFVRLEDCMPRMVPKGRTMETAIVKSARISYGQGLKDQKADDNLIRYLVRNYHTSPLESVKFTFHIRAPKFVAIQMIRHRTANVNEFSQRYSMINENAYYHPSQISSDEVKGSGIRLQSATNKQGSSFETVEEEKRKAIEAELKSTEDDLDKMYEHYLRLVELGLVKEVSRFCLPTAMYTELYYTMDLNNLMKFLALRMDEHAQAEIVVFARAMYELIKDLVPVALETFINHRVESLSLSKSEIEAIQNRHSELKTTSISEKKEYREKLKLLGLDFQTQEAQSQPQCKQCFGGTGSVDCTYN
jgi:thymidylate synthase (FAD)